MQGVKLGEKEPRLSGVYVIWNHQTGKRYVGGSVSCFERFRGHKIRLRRDKHENRYLQEDWNKYGADSFSFAVLDPVDKMGLRGAEQYWIDTYKTCDRRFGYNVNPFADGSGHADESKKRISESRIGDKNPIHKHVYTDRERTDASLRFSGPHRRGNGWKSWSPDNAGEKHGMWGRTQSDDAKRMIREANKYLKSPIIQMLPDGTILRRWETKKQASSELGLYSRGMHQCATGRRTIYAGYTWKYE